MMSQILECWLLGPYHGLATPWWWKKGKTTGKIFSFGSRVRRTVLGGYFEIQRISNKFINILNSN